MAEEIEQGSTEIEYSAVGSATDEQVRESSPQDPAEDNAAPTDTGSAGAASPDEEAPVEQDLRQRAPEYPPDDFPPDDQEDYPERTDGDMMQLLFEDLLRAMEVRATVRVREDSDEQVTLDILNCPDASLVIGRHGQTVDDLQYLGGLILNSNRRERKRFLLNVENYRERREEILRHSAVELAQQVIEYGQEAVLDPLPPHERRIIHMALVDLHEVYTYSEGEEPDRRIVISPRHLGPHAVAPEAAEGNGAHAGVTAESAQEDEPQEQSEEQTLDKGAESVENPAFGENKIGGEQQDLYRSTTEFGMDVNHEHPGAGFETAGSGEGTPYADAVGPDSLPETTPGGGSHEGHTGD